MYQLYLNDVFIESFDDVDEAVREMILIIDLPKDYAYIKLKSDGSIFARSYW